MGTAGGSGAPRGGFARRLVGGFFVTRSLEAIQRDGRRIATLRRAGSSSSCLHRSKGESGTSLPCSNRRSSLWHRHPLDSLRIGKTAAARRLAASAAVSPWEAVVVAGSGERSSKRKCLDIGGGEAVVGKREAAIVAIIRRGAGLVEKGRRRYHEDRLGRPSDLLPAVVAANELLLRHKVVGMSLRGGGNHQVWRSRFC